MNVAVGDVVASTCQEAATQRARLLSSLHAQDVIELCVGPSLPLLKEEYGKLGVRCIGNDVDPRWDTELPGDCLRVPWLPGDAVVFAPPLSRGCTGRREDSLRIGEVEPSYDLFLEEWASRNGFPELALMVLPARSLSTRRDRSELYRLVAMARELGEVRLEPVLVGRRSVRKYVHLLVRRRGMMLPWMTI